MHIAIRVIVGVLGVWLWCGTFTSVLRTLVVPRGTSGLVKYKNDLLLRGFRLVARSRGTYAGRDRVLLWLAPISIVSSLIMWLVMFFVAYACLLFATNPLAVGSAFREAGSSLFTLGFASGDRYTLTAIDFVAAATGPIVIGLLIAYLPTMYGAFQAREAAVTLLQARAGEPNWAPELLVRHAMVDNTEKLSDLWPAWEEWAGLVAESHTNFPVLIQMRSTRAQRNWLVALIAVMDAAAMRLALNPGEPQGAMRLTLRQGIVCLRELADVMGITYDDDPDPQTPSSVTEADFAAACDLLGEFGYPIDREPAEAYRHFRGWRANYESIAYALASAIDAVPAPWTGPRHPPLPTELPPRLANRQPGGGVGPPA